MMKEAGVSPKSPGLAAARLCRSRIMMNYVVKTMKSAFEMMNSAFKMMNSAFKMMNSSPVPQQKNDRMPRITTSAPMSESGACCNVIFVVFNTKFRGL